ncbi:hypothetical protein [Arthrobacter sp. ISL-72]|uniref:hypothetical protein n=1 Tax=Arthrobacter sp. ISL-72 TaxID=2819114 RepID=UPI00288AC144|nr:hypothetical protein [Arthrobacter sp. ISL-72]
MGKGAFIKMYIRELWDRLDSATQKWLTDNQGCQILPRAMSAKISTAAGGRNIERDSHGQMVLSAEDLDFMRAKATAQASSVEARIFDATET